MISGNDHTSTYLSKCGKCMVRYGDNRVSRNSSDAKHGVLRLNRVIGLVMPSFVWRLIQARTYQYSICAFSLHLWRHWLLASHPLLGRLYCSWVGNDFIKWRVLLGRIWYQCCGWANSDRRIGTWDRTQKALLTAFSAKRLALHFHCEHKCRCTFCFVLARRYVPPGIVTLVSTYTLELVGTQLHTKSWEPWQWLCYSQAWLALLWLITHHS